MTNEKTNEREEEEERQQKQKQLIDQLRLLRRLLERQRKGEKITFDVDDPIVSKELQQLEDILRKKLGIVEGEEEK